MKNLFQTAFWLLIIYSALTVELATVNQIAIEALFISLLIFPAFYYRDLTTYLNKAQ